MSQASASRPATAPERSLSPQELRALLDVTRALAAPFDLGAMLSAVAQAASTTLRAERVSVWLHDPAGDELVLEVSSDLHSARVPAGAGLVGACARHRQPIVVPDCYADPRFDPSMDRRSGFRSRCSLTLPLIDHAGRLVGVMQVLNRRGGVFDASDLPLAEALAAQCAVALTRVRMTQAAIEGERLRRELEVARSLQLSTLPGALPVVEGYAMHAVFRPAEQTGGDTYDVAYTPHGLLLALGDAAGHGIAPALMVTQMHAMLRMALRLGVDLDTAFREVNDQLAATYSDGRFVTAFLGLLDTRRHRLRYLSGGQSPILHLPAASGRCVRHGATSFPLGAMPIERLRPAIQIDLAPGDVLALLTDGVFEAMDTGGAPWGIDAVEEVLCRHRAEPLEMLAEQLLAAMAGHTRGAPPSDDVTMLLVRREPTPRGRAPMAAA